MAFTIRNATVKDSESMDSLNRICLPENYPLVEWRNILTIMTGISTVMHDINGKLVGYCLGIAYPHTHSGVIASLAVHPNYRGKGLAKNLLETCICNMKTKDIYTVTLNVRISNIIAHRLYKKFSFRKHKHIPGYYADGEDAFEMKLNLF